MAILTKPHTYDVDKRDEKSLSPIIKSTSGLVGEEKYSTIKWDDPKLAALVDHANGIWRIRKILIGIQ